MIFHFKLKYKYLYAVILTVVIFSISLVAVRHLRKGTVCTDPEPIDVVYTWVNGSDELFLRQLSEFLRQNKSRRTDVSMSRYTDRYELKFSLRSLEKYAPWIRNVYIVTNGQIPYWLNLDYEKVFLITHQEIFTNPDDLPTFSSPAIETHLHRIPGISRRFLYFNDDVYLGAPVYVEDFMSPDRGFLIYFNHPLQSCSKDCPWLYVRDGQCDPECNNSNCQMDGGDCDGIGKIIRWDDQKLANVTEMNMPARTAEDNMTSSRLESNDTFISKLWNVDVDDINNMVVEHNRKVLFRNRVKRKQETGRRFRFKDGEKSINGYMESLQHTNRLLNVHYRFMPRYVPVHMPFLVDVDVVKEFQSRFEQEVKTTSANRVRSSNDVQFSFGYYYFIFHELIDVTIEEIFDLFDTDDSGTWSDREIRTILTKIYRLPLNYADVDEFDSVLINCSKSVGHVELATPEYERYVDSILPTIAKETVCRCPNLSDILIRKFGSKPKYKYEVVTDVNKYVSFQMLTNNAPDTIKKLDGLRRNPTKFVCLNDNMGDDSVGSVVNALWYDFYISLFPNLSRFELPPEYRNKFLYVGELRSYHLRLKLYVYSCAAFLIYVTVCMLCRRKIVYFVRNKLFH